EARAAAGLDHPHLVPVFEAGADGPFCYLVSAYCPGTDLAAWLRGRAELPPCREAAALLATLAGAVHHAHVRGVVHRDLKPSNVLLGPAADGAPGPLPFVPRVTDFGLAKLPRAEADAGQTQSGVVVGTPAYI